MREGGREGGRAGVIKKGGNRVYEIGLKALQGLERERKKGKRQKDREKRRSYRVRLGILKGTLVKEE